MKKNLFKMGALSLAAAMLLAVPTSALGFTHSTTDVASGHDTCSAGNYTNWSLLVDSQHAVSSGSINLGYTGTVQCNVTVNNTPYTTTASNTNTLTQNGIGSSASITFSGLVITSVSVGKTVRLGGLQSTSGSYQQANWYINITSSYCEAHGWMSFGYSDSIECWCGVTGNDSVATQMDDNDLILQGFGEAAEIVFM